MANKVRNYRQYEVIKKQPCKKWQRCNVRYWKVQKSSKPRRTWLRSIPIVLGTFEERYRMKVYSVDGLFCENRRNIEKWKISVDYKKDRMQMLSHGSWLITHHISRFQIPSQYLN